MRTYTFEEIKSIAQEQADTDYDTPFRWVGRLDGVLCIRQWAGAFDDKSRDGELLGCVQRAGLGMSANSQEQ